MKPATPEVVAQAERALEILGGFATRRHIMICADPEKPKCCDREVGTQSWNFLKRRLNHRRWQGHVLRWAKVKILTRPKVPA